MSNRYSTIMKKASAKVLPDLGLYPWPGSNSSLARWQTAPEFRKPPLARQEARPKRKVWASALKQLQANLPDGPPNGDMKLPSTSARISVQRLQNTQ